MVNGCQKTLPLQTDGERGFVLCGAGKAGNGRNLGKGTHWPRSFFSKITNHAHRTWFDEAPSKGAKSPAAASSIPRGFVFITPQLSRPIKPHPMSQIEHRFQVSSISDYMNESPKLKTQDFFPTPLFVGQHFPPERYNLLGSHGHSPWFN